MGFDEASGVAHRWRHANDRLLQNPNLDESDFLALAWRYLRDKWDERTGGPELVFDPLPPVELRYGRDAPELLSLATALTRQLAQAYAVARENNRSMSGA